MLHEEAVEDWGKADNGDLVSLRFPAGGEAELLSRWPPIGLERVAKEPSDVAALSLEVPPDDSRGWDRLESSLTIFTSDRLNTLVAFHAGLFGDPENAILVPGPTHSGKSSLCRVAMESGVRVYSDELALADPSTGLVAGWPRPLRVRHSDGSLERIPLPGAGEDAEVIPAVRIGLVAVLTYAEGRPGEPFLHTRSMTGGEICMSLVANAVCAQRRPRDTFSAALAIGRSTRGVQGGRGEASSALRALLRMASR